MGDTLVQKDAPDFKAEALVGKTFKEIKLADYNGKWLVLFFYPLDFTFVCPTEITAFSDRMGDFKKLGAEVLGCSVDSKFSHLAWSEKPRKEGGLGAIEYPLLSDITKSIARAYGVLVNDSVALRGLFLIDPKGKVAYSVVHDLGVGRSVDETLRVIAAFQQVAKTGEVCPANWNSGKKTMKADPVKSKEYFETVA
jgi:peroxiredoxin (alkyl hydroperoxide reductase subunit C)